MKKLIAALLFVSCVSVLFAQSSSRSNSGIANVMTGLLHVIERGEYSEGESGSSMDYSLQWKKNYITVEAPADSDRMNGKHKQGSTKELGSVEFVFDGYSFYLFGQNNRSKHRNLPPVITIDGTVTLNGQKESLDGKLAVRGVESVRSIAFNDFQLEAPQGSALINDQEFDAQTLQELLGDYYWDSIIDTDMESGIVFFIAFMAMMTTDISAQFDALGEAALNEVPAGIMAVNSEKTLTITTQTNQFDMTFNDFVLNYEFYYYGPSPLITGALTMRVNMNDGEMNSLTFDGKIDIRKMFFVTSLKFDSCTMTTNLQKFSGTLTVNGKENSFSRFVGALKSAESLF